MRIVAMIGGLGSQMLKYSFYLMLKEKYKTECYIDTTPCYLNPIWNGYELKRIFNIQAPDLADQVPAARYREIIAMYPLYRDAALQIVRELSDSKIQHVILDGMAQPWKFIKPRNLISSIKKIVKPYVGWLISMRSAMTGIKQTKSTCSTNVVKQYYRDNVWELSGDVYFDEFAHSSDQYFQDLHSEILAAFQFPAFMDDLNVRTSNAMKTSSSVTMHIRRSDHMYDCATLFDDGYFRRATEFMKSHTVNPVFYLFSEDMLWCKTHLNELGFSNADSVIFVDWNTSVDSYRDMQLMTSCRCHIIGKSCFAWWGHYLCTRQDKLACAPIDSWHDIEYHL